MSERLATEETMLQFAYPAIFKPDRDGRPVVSFPDFPEAHTDGKDVQEAIEEAIDCLGSTVSIRMSMKEDIPEPSRSKRGQRLIPVPFWIAGKLGLYLAMRERGLSNSEFARRLGVRETVVRRMLDPEHATKPEKLQAALEVLGKHLAVSIRDAA
jgi:antitoxin HicB